VLTVVGNSLIAIASALLYHFEHGINPKINSLLDTVWWAVATVTTVGYGDVSPITNIGKIIGIFMMIVGTALFWSYTALFAGAIMSEEAKEIREIKNEN
jgi:voltage-gated potassium channel